MRCDIQAPPIRLGIILTASLCAATIGCGPGIDASSLEDAADHKAGVNPGTDACVGAECASLHAVGLAAGGGHTCALLSSGHVRCWGNGAFGQLGNESTESIGDDPKETAPDVDVGGPVKQIVAGGDHTCALLDTGRVRCWGYGYWGQLGYGDKGNLGGRPGDMPPPDVPVGGIVTRLAAGQDYTCAVMATGNVRCWGAGFTGQLGYGSTDDIGDEPGEMPPPDVALGSIVTQVAVGRVHTCALLTAGNVRCWGASAAGKLGYGNEINIGLEPGQMPPSDVNVGGAVVELAAGGYHTCALTSSGGVRCWGFGYYGALGYGNGDDIGDQAGEMPPPDVDVRGGVVQLVAGREHSCALVSPGNVRCWGRGNYGQLGYQNTDFVGDGPGEMPRPDVDVGSIVTQVVAGSEHTCALLQGGSVRCWGSSEYGQLGYGNTNNVGDEYDEMPPLDVPLVQ